VPETSCGRPRRFPNSPADEWTCSIRRGRVGLCLCCRLAPCRALRSRRLPPPSIVADPKPSPEHLPGARELSDHDVAQGGLFLSAVAFTVPASVAGGPVDACRWRPGASMRRRSPRPRRRSANLARQHARAGRVGRGRCPAATATRLTGGWATTGWCSRWCSRCMRQPEASWVVHWRVRIRMRRVETLREGSCETEKPGVDSSILSLGTLFINAFQIQHPPKVAQV
jgi:hypothetical protein